jgi:hypothetical protein
MLSIFTNQEYEKILLQFASGQKEFTEDQALFVVKWCEQAYISGLLVDMLIEGKVTCSINKEGNDLNFQSI